MENCIRIAVCDDLQTDREKIISLLSSYLDQNELEDSRSKSRKIKGERLSFGYSVHRGKGKKDSDPHENRYSGSVAVTVGNGPDPANQRFLYADPVGTGFHA